MARDGAVDKPITLVVKFYQSSSLFTPYDVDDVKIYDAASGGTLITTITPTTSSVGIYEALWNVPRIDGGAYYDEWTWTAEEGMDANVRRNSFNISNPHGASRAMANLGVHRGGRIKTDVTLTVKFYEDGVLTSPYSVDDVKIYDAASGGNLFATITPTESSTGVYIVTWSVPYIHPGRYYDEWTWKGHIDQSENKVVRYGFDISTIPGIDPVKKKEGPALFVGRKELQYFNTVTKELMQCIIGQKVIYYAVSEEHTNSHRLYGEAIKKTTYRPIEVNALVQYEEPTQTNTQFSIDTQYNIEVYFYTKELHERNLVPREGDFVKFGYIVYEIKQLSRAQITYGQMHNEVMLKASCTVSRKSQIEILDDIPGV